MRGLPWSTTVDEIIEFFSGCTISHGRDGVFIVMTKEGRPSGEAFIELETEDDLEKALKRDRQYVGTRYIEGKFFELVSSNLIFFVVFKCKKSEMEWVVRRSGSQMDNALDDGCVRLRGLPFGCSKEEIAQFFTGIGIDRRSRGSGRQGRIVFSN